MGNTLGRYVLREVVTAWLLVTGVLLVILLVNQMVGVLERAAASQYPEGVVLELIGLGALQNLSILLPVGLLLGVVLAFGRLYHDSDGRGARLRRGSCEHLPAGGAARGPRHRRPCLAHAGAGAERYGARAQPAQRRAARRSVRADRAR